MNKKKVVSLDISIGSYDKFIQEIINLASNNISSVVCVSNVHMNIEGHWDQEFARTVSEAEIITPDGMPIVKAINYLYGIKQDRVAGMDLMPDIIKRAEQENLGIYFYGGSKEMMKPTESFVSQNYPNLQNTGFYSPPFRPLTQSEEIQVIKRINESGAHIVFVALGCPKQEKWMAGMKGRINACMIGIGGALPVMIGMQRRAPKWMQKMSLEWLFRLFQEPKRLFKRYFLTNSIFLLLFIVQFIRVIILRKDI